MVGSVATPCKLTFTLPVDLMHPSEPRSSTMTCNFVTNKHGQHTKSSWCSAEKTDLGTDHVLRVVKVYLRAREAELRSASRARRLRLLKPVYAWVTWYKKGPNAPRVIGITEPNTYAVHPAMQLVVDGRGGDGADPVTVGP